jgi:methionine synthase II (cobalamin-independent)
MIQRNMKYALQHTYKKYKWHTHVQQSVCNSTADIISDYQVTDFSDTLHEHHSVMSKMDSKKGDHIQIVFITRQMTHKQWEFNSEMHILSVGYVKASDRVTCKKMQKVMKNTGYPKH